MKRLFILLLCIHCFMYSDNSDESSVTSAWDGAKSFFSAKNLGNMWSGLKRSIGIPPNGYVYTWEIYNDADQVIYGGAKDIASFMGAFFPSAKGFNGTIKTLQPWTDLKSGHLQAVRWDSVPLYQEVRFATQSDCKDGILYKKMESELIEKHSTNCWVFHGYTKREMVHGAVQHNPAVEMLGFYKTDADSSKSSQADKSDDASSSSSSKTASSSGDHSVKTQLLGGDVRIQSIGDVYGSLQGKTTSSSSSTDKSSSAQKSDGKSDASKGNITIGKQLSKFTLFNSSTYDAAVKFMYNGKQMQVVVEKDSFGLCDVLTDAQGKPTFSLRPNNIEVIKATKSDATTGWSGGVLVEQGIEKQTMHFETALSGDDLKLYVQGFLSGNYDPPTSDRVRDITPVLCTFWWESVDQLAKAEKMEQAKDIMYDLSGQLWIVYQGMDSPIMAQVKPGQAVNWYLFRPRLAEQTKYVYFVYVQTNDDAKAKQFVQNFVDKKFGTHIHDMYDAWFEKVQLLEKVQKVTDAQSLKSAQKSVEVALSTDEKVKTLDAKLQISQDTLTDPQTGLHGYCLGLDLFEPRGGAATQYYYTLLPVMLQFNTLVNIIMMYCDQSKLQASMKSDKATQGSVQDWLIAKIKKWLAAFVQDQATVTQEVTTFYMANLADKYVQASSTTSGTSKKGSSSVKVLTKLGSVALQSFLTGGVSLKNPPVEMKVVRNHYAYDLGAAAPQGLPTKQTWLSNAKPSAAGADHAKAAATSG